jgi:hypothetical protein
MKKYIVIIIVLLLLNITFATTIYAEGPSNWAAKEIEELKATKYFDLNRFNNYQNSITRGEFIYFATRLFEIMSGQEILVDKSINYNDTSDTWALKGSTVNITSGVGNEQFAPDKILTREEFATMIIRTLNLGKISLKEPNNFTFSDDKDISSWAKESMYIAKENDILNGVGNNLSAPKQEATLEQCIVIINRILKNNKGKEFTYNNNKNLIPYDNEVEDVDVIEYSIGKYTGELKNSIPNGTGTMIYDNGDIYEGEWIDGLRHGNGIFTTYNEDGEVATYNGNWENDKKNGSGIYKDEDYEYMGSWKNDKKHGNGTLESTVIEYIGQWVDGYMQGQGEYIFHFLESFKQHYVGELYMDSFSGVGKLETFEDGKLTKVENGYFVRDHFTGEDKNLPLPKNSRYLNITIDNDTGKYYGETSLNTSTYDYEANGYGIINFENGNKYIGLWKNNQYNGLGTLIKSNGSSTEGYWSYGKLQYPVKVKNGDSVSFSGGNYTGELMGIIPHGYGVLEFQNGEKYEGYFEYGDKSGKGIQTWSDGEFYDGYWKNSKYDGQGTYYSKKALTVGEWKENFVHGFSRIEFENGKIYEGEWKYGKFHGKGTYTWPDGKTYEGEWEDNEYSGFGKLTWPDGKTYEGEWKDNEYSGFGKLTWPDGSIYEGDWLNGKPNGYGKMNYSNGSTYEGDWSYGIPRGNCIYIWPDGKVYEGQWENNQPNGYGKVTMPDGTIYEGQWEEGYFIR